jgi:ATP-dependent DNA helicase RecG
LKTVESQNTESKSIWRDEYLEERITLDDIDIETIKKGRITNKEYQDLCEVKKRQSTDDLKELEEKELFERIGTTGKGTYYILKGHQRGIRDSEKNDL